MDYIDLNGLDRQASREYMDEYDTDIPAERNPDYPSFTSNCANYVSQCLEAGGVKQVPGKWYCKEVSFEDTLFQYDIFQKYMKIKNLELRFFGINAYHSQDEYYDEGVGWNGDALHSTTWTAAHDQYKYFKKKKNGYINGKVIKIESYDDLQDAIAESNFQIGDLLYWDREGDGKMDHATILSKVDTDYLYYAGNTDPRFDEKLTKDKFDTYERLYLIMLKDEVFEDDICPE